MPFNDKSGGDRHEKCVKRCEARDKSNAGESGKWGRRCVRNVYLVCLWYEVQKVGSHFCGGISGLERQRERE